MAVTTLTEPLTCPYCRLVVTVGWGYDVTVTTPDGATHHYHRHCWTNYQRQLNPTRYL